MLKKILLIAAALCGSTGLAHGALSYRQSPSLFVGGGQANQQAIATNGAGVTVAAWSAPGGVLDEVCPYCSTTSSLFIMRYDAKGNPLGSLIRIDPSFRGCENCNLQSLTQPMVAIDPLGRFLVAWRGSSYGLSGRLYDAQGRMMKELELLQGSEVANSGNSKFDLRMDSNGNFIIVYRRQVFPQYGIFVRRFIAQGERVGEEITVENDPASDINPTLAVSGNGAFIVAWQRPRTTDCADSQYSKPKQCDDILLRRFDNQGVPLGSETKVADGNNNLDQTPAIAMDQQGSFVVAWDRYRDLCQNLLQCDDILAQRYSSAGAKQGAVLAIIANNNRNDISPQAIMDDNGKFVVMWHRDKILSGSTVISPADALFRAFDANGISLGGTVSYRVASGLSTSQFDNVYPRVGISDTGQLSVLWLTDLTSQGSTNKVLIFRQMIPSAW